MANNGAGKAALKKEADKKKAAAKKATDKKAADKKKGAADTKKGGADKKGAAGQPAAASKPQPDDDPSSPKSDSRQTYDARVNNRKANSSGDGSDEELLRAEANAVLQMNALYAPGEPTRTGLSEDTAQSSGEDEEVQIFNFGMIAHYAFDNWMAKQSSPFVLVAVMVAVIMLVGGMGVYAIDVRDTFLEGCWLAWLWINDPSAHAGEGPGSGRVLGVFTSMIGLFIFAMLMGFVFDLITVQMAELRKGKSMVVERDHTLILGWTDKLYTILTELCDANETRPDGTEGGVVVILATPGGMAPECKDDMIAELDERIDEEQRKGTIFVVRVGSPMLYSDLQKVAAQDARSIVVLCDDDGEADKADAAVLRTVVALGAALPKYSEAHITTQIRETDCIPLLQLVCSDRCETVVSHDIVGRLMVMAVRQPGLAKIYEQLLGFEGDEFYIEAWPQTIGKPFGDLFQHFPDAIPLGIKTEDGTVLIKPPMKRKIVAGDEILVLSEDDDTYHYVDASCDAPTAPAKPKSNKKPEKMLIVGWRRDFRDMLMLMNDLMMEGSEIHVLASKPCGERDADLEDAGVDFSLLTNVELVHHEGHARRHFEKLPLEQFTSCMIVADEESEDDLMNSDSICIQTLLLVRDVQMNRNRQDGQSEAEQRKIAAACPILVETLDPRTQDCIVSSQPLQAIADFVQSNEMVSRVLAMVSENRSVNMILSELLGGTGAGFELKLADRYLNTPSEQLTFLQFSKRMLEYNEILVGYQLFPSSVDANTVMNPRDKLVSKDWQGVLLITLSGQPFHPHLHDSDAESKNQNWM